MNIKKIRMLISMNSDCERFFRTIYILIKNPRFLEYRKSFGKKNPDKIFYVIRPNSEDGIQGLMSLFIQTMRKIDYAKRKGYIPIVDFKNYKTQYWDGINNAWELFFEQPTNISLEEIYQSKNVILSGASIWKRENMKLFKETIFFDKKIAEYCNKLILENINLNRDIINSINFEKKEINVDKCIGVYIRGTDYIKLKPVGEYVQPSIDEMINKIKEFLKKYPDNNIFLVTEDNEYYEVLKDEFGEKIKTVSFDTFIDRKKVDTFLSKTELLKKDLIERGKDYLIKEILLSECEYLISSITCGSVAAFAFNGNSYKDKFIFNKGKY